MHMRKLLFLTALLLTVAGHTAAYAQEEGALPQRATVVTDGDNAGTGEEGADDGGNPADETGAGDVPADNAGGGDDSNTLPDPSPAENGATDSILAPPPDEGRGE